MMTRKDYEAIANAILCVPKWNDDSAMTVKRSAENISEVLQADNPRFDRARFLKACGVA